MIRSCDFLIVGGGIAGTSLGYRLAEYGRVIVLEAEPITGYHASGRSATYFTLSIGYRPIRVITAASRSWFEDPPTGFADHALYTPLPLLNIASAAQKLEIEKYLTDIREVAPDAYGIDADELRRRVPILRVGPETAWVGAVEPSCFRIDGHALLQGYVSGIRRQGGAIVTRASAEQIGFSKEGWRVTTPQGDFQAPILINAAGAWGDHIAALAGVASVGLSPRRRTVVTFDLPQGISAEGYPFVHSMDESFYFLPESGGVLLSPFDETPVEPHDVQPDDLDVAIAIARFEAATTVEVTRIRSQWAGLRTFAPDRLPVIGFEERAPGFFWYVGQGGTGLQTSPMLSTAAAALISGKAWPVELAREGITAEMIGPQRLSTRASREVKER